MNFWVSTIGGFSGSGSRANSVILCQTDFCIIYKTPTKHILIYVLGRLPLNYPSTGFVIHCFMVDFLCFMVDLSIHWSSKWQGWLPSGERLHSNGIDGPVEIVDFPMKNGGSFHSFLFTRPGIHHHGDQIPLQMGSPRSPTEASQKSDAHEDVGMG